MPYSIPTPTEFKVTFPEFADKGDPELQTAITAGARNVDTTWSEGDYTRAIGLFAAHLLASGAIAASGQEIASESIGPFSVSYFKSDKGWMSSTAYGQQFTSLSGKNNPPIMVI